MFCDWHKTFIKLIINFKILCSYFLIFSRQRLGDSFINLNIIRQAFIKLTISRIIKISEFNELILPCEKYTPVQT